MARTDADYEYLREDTGRTDDTLDDSAAEAIYLQAESIYATAGVYAGARVLILRKDWATASSQADYTQNEESEKLSQIADAKKALLLYWEGRLTADIAQDAAVNGSGSVRSGRSTRKPARIKEYPGSWGW
jgi:hypothetical protein